MEFTPASAVEAFKSRVFLVAIAIKQACPSRIQFDADLTRSEATLEALTRNGAKIGKDSLPIFEVVDTGGKVIFSANKARVKLSTVLDGLQCQYMASQGSGSDWYVPESRIEDLDYSLKTEMDAAVTEQLGYFADYYDDAKSLYCDRLSDLLTALKIEDWEEYYLSKFPTLEEIEQSFGYEITKWEPMKTLAEVMAQAATDPALSRSVEVAERQLQSAQGDAAALLNEALGLLAAIATKLEAGHSVADEDTERVAIISDLLIGLMGQPNELLEEIAFRLSLLPVGAELSAIREEWQQSLELPGEGDGDGAIAFSHWLFPERRIQAEVDTIQQKLETDLYPDVRAKMMKRLGALQGELEVLQPKRVVAELVEVC